MKYEFQTRSKKSGRDDTVTALHKIASEISTLAFRVSENGQEDLEQISAVSRAKKMAKEKRARSQFFSEKICGEPAWDIMLDLFVAKANGMNVSVSSACIGSGVAPTTALRWIAMLEDNNIIFRKFDPEDQRRSFLELTESANDRMNRYFDYIRDM
ncbi:exosome complex RNA-binding protein Rrp42 (RNase PH superfamily) [Sphingomonas kyeonggiensis]|uniref:MarR family winged helix-turn-helix transcriptional regulator n=1 Tax=Sphingomonas kyeonggiensis TaxID=1268553 RepID=UPI0027824F20|nr:MarR family winged helix-turn-helix transcriptional regulator [Sphingomonas kyeonggiensis]MDQ0251078.1 exosome complex RNA-binding protein Rrp42 (RNase PH superfamily) [Sphingomonas kyeonggiensis]